MTIFVDPYQTTAGVIIDLNKTLTPLKESTIRDSLTGTNLGVRTYQGVTPVFITGCRDSEQAVPSFTHPIFIKNFNGKSYLFTDMRQFIKAGASLETIESHIRHREEFDFTKARAIASLIWASGDHRRLREASDFAGEVFSMWISQTLSREFALDFMATVKIQMIALAYWEGLFEENAKPLSDDADTRMLLAQKVARYWRVPVQQSVEFYKTLKMPMFNIPEFCSTVVESLDNVNLNPIPNNPNSGFNVRVLLNLIADAWFSHESKKILATSLEHPPTFAAIVYYCSTYNNFRRQQLGQVIQSVGRNGNGKVFITAFQRIFEEMTQPEVKLRSVMEYIDPSVYQAPAESDEDAVSRLMAQMSLQESQDNQIDNQELQAISDRVEVFIPQFSIKG